MNSYLLLLFVNSILCVSCNTVHPDDLLKSAKDNLQTSNYISYIETAHYPIPDNDLVDTIITNIEFLKVKEGPVGYNYVQTSNRRDVIYQDDILRISDHMDSVVRIISPDQFETREEFNQSIERNFRGRWSPMTLLSQEWKYISDTTFNQMQFENYFQIEREEEYEGKTIYVELHIFINSKNSLLQKFERRNFLDGTLTQRITVNYSNYQLHHDPVNLSYELPNNYTTTYDMEKKLPTIEIDNPAPKFQAVTLAGDSISLETLKGKKILLNFSVISCGYSAMALKYFNQDNYKLTDLVSIVYVNPVDDEERLRTYMKSMNIPFPVIAKATEIGKKYGVSSYPGFFLINEEGIIEKVQIGYSEDFLDEYRQ